MNATDKDSTTQGICQSCLPVFLQDWWLSVAREALRRPYREASVVQGGITVGYLAYAIKRNRIGIRSWQPLDWCRINEPIVSPALSASEKASVLTDLIGQLPRNRSFEFVCGPFAKDLRLIDTIAQAAGFCKRLETIFWQAPEAAKTIMARVSSKYRRSINKARGELRFINLSADQFIALYDTNLKAAGRRPYSDSEVARKLIVTGLSRSNPQVRIFAVQKKTALPGASFVDAAIACVWDNERYYYWMTTCSRFSGASMVETAHTHAVKYLVVTAIQDAGERGLIFDTDGGDTEGAAKQFLDLKFPNIAQRIVFTRHTLPLKIYNKARPLFKRAAIYFGYKHII
jgi:hypothetical protein